MSVTTPTLKFFADVDEELLPDELAAALDEPLELDELLLLLPHAASASAATAPTMHVPMRPLFNITRNSLSKLGKRRTYNTEPTDARSPTRPFTA
jgi:hypothetical protein